MLLLALPILSGALPLMFGELHCNALFFNSMFGGDPIPYQHLFWFLDIQACTSERLISDLCDAICFFSWKSCLGTSYVHCRLRK